MPPTQMRLLPAPKPLLEQFGEPFFRRIPRRAGVYLMGDGLGRLLYVGKAGNLRQRLNQYKNLDLDRASRKTRRLMREVRSITWEIMDTGEAALLRENELLRLHKPKYNRMNTRPEFYAVVVVGVTPDAILLCPSRAGASPVKGTVHGAFKGVGVVREVCRSWLRLFHAIAEPVATPFDFPRTSYAQRIVQPLRLPFGRLPMPATAKALEAYFSGASVNLVEILGQELKADYAPAVRRILEQDLEHLRNFFRWGPERNRRLREEHGLAGVYIEPAELDDLLVMQGPQR